MSTDAVAWRYKEKCSQDQLRGGGQFPENNGMETYTAVLKLW